MNLILTFHTEKLDSDAVWQRVRWMLVFLEQHHIQATFFCVAPVHAYYKNQPHFSEAKWVDRLNEIAKRGHSIEQHTHFYGSEGKKSDTSPENLCRRLAEDRQWLQAQGFTPVGFVGGGWTIGSEIFQFLLTHNYKYDCSARSFDLAYLQSRRHSLLAQHPFLLRSDNRSLLEIPTTAPVINVAYSLLPFSGRKIHIDVKHWGRYAMIYLHDYDLLNPKFRITLRAALHWYRIRGRKFMTVDTLYEGLSSVHLPAHILEGIQL